MLNYNDISSVFSLFYGEEARSSMTDDPNKQILQAIKELNNQMNEGFQKIDECFEAIDERFVAMDKRFDNMEAKQEKMQNSIDILASRGLDNEADIVGIKKAIGLQ